MQTAYNGHQSTMTHRTLVMIRPIDAAQKFISALESHTNKPANVIYSPLIGIEPLVTSFDLQDVTLLLFTSVNGVEFYARATVRRDIPALCVGVTTQNAAIAQGINALNAGGSAELLLAAALELGSPDGQKFLYLCGEQVSFDLITPLRAANIAVEQTVLYRQIPLKISAAAIAEISTASAVIPVFSMNGAKALVTALTGATIKNTLFLAISPQVADHLHATGFGDVLCARSPTRSAMIHTLGQML